MPLAGVYGYRRIFLCLAMKKISFLYCQICYSCLYQTMLNKTYNVPGANVPFVVLENMFKIKADISVYMCVDLQKMYRRALSDWP
jgi:hypothetical protein